MMNFRYQLLVKNPLVMTNGNTELKVNHFDHHMYSTANNVTISGVKSGAETTLNGAISSSVPPQLLLPLELTLMIRLESFLGTHQMFTLSKSVMRLFLTHRYQVMSSQVRQETVEGTVASHANGATVELYMLHKVPFTEINKTHTSIANIGTDYYTVTLSTTPVVASGGDSQFGGTVVKATENAQYDVNGTIMGTLFPPDTSVVAKIRHTTATSPSGTQTSFVTNFVEQRRNNSFK